MNAIEEKSRIIRLPSNIGSALSKLEKASESRGNFRSFYSDRFLREVALELHTTETHIKHLIMISHVSTSFDELSDSEKCASNMRNCLRTDDSELLDEKISHESLIREINNALHILTERESEVLQYRFGLNGKVPLTLSEVGQKYCLTKERIRQIEANALQKLRNWSGCTRLRSYRR